MGKIRNRYPLTIGEFIIDEYCIEGILYKDNMSITYLAVDVNLENKEMDSVSRVAIKEYFPQTVLRNKKTQKVINQRENEENAFHQGLEYFCKEGQILALFNNNNIVRIRRLIRANQTAYLVMDYSRGVTLEQALMTKSVMSYDNIRRIFMPILDGLQEIHRKNVLHLDIKPENIFVRIEGDSFLTGFSHADIINKSSTMNSRLVVNDGYAPPEQYTNKDLSVATDVYAVGATIFRCITNLKPESSTKRLMDITSNEPDPLKLKERLKDLSSDYPDYFLRTLKRSLELSASKRPQTIRELQTRLFYYRQWTQANFMKRLLDFMKSLF